MSAVGITELKNRLSYYLQAIRRGEEVIILDRSKPIAKIVPLENLDDYETEELELVASGILRLPESPELSPSFWKQARPKVKAQDAINAVLYEREENRY